MRAVRHLDTLFPPFFFSFFLLPTVSSLFNQTLFMKQPSFLLSFVCIEKQVVHEMFSAKNVRRNSCKDEERDETPECVPEVYSERFVYEIGYVPTYDGETDMSRPYCWAPSPNDVGSCMAPNRKSPQMKRTQKH